MFARLLKPLLPIATLLVGAGAMMFLGRSAAEPDKAPESALPPLVETTVLARADHRVRIVGQGRVVAARQLELSSAIAGRVSWKHELLVPGSAFGAGTALVRLDPRDLMTAVANAKAAVKRAQRDLSQEIAEQQVAEGAWAELGGAKEASAGAKRAPQVAHAKAEVESAESQLAQAERTLGKAVLVAPFNASVQSVQAEVGQNVAAGQVIATLVGTDAYWVQTSVAVDDLPLIDLPRGETSGSHAEVGQRVRGRAITRPARVLRLRSELAAEGGMAQLLLRVEKPTEVRAEGDVPLLLGAYVDVVIHGATLTDVFEIPRTALHEGDTAYVLTKDRTLAIRQLHIVHRYRDSVLVDRGLADGEALITSPVPTRIEGLKLRERERDAVSSGKPTETAT